MNWILADLLMFVFSVILFLTIRKAGLVGFPSQIVNLAMFGVPMVFYVLGSMANSEDYGLLSSGIWLLLLATGVLAYVSNAASLRSIERAPNPGYSLVISKSAVILTVFLAVPLLGSKLTLKAVLAVLLIMAFSMLIIIDNPKRKKMRPKKGEGWLPLSLVAFVGWAFLALSAKFLFVHGATTLVFLAVLFTVVTACIVQEVRHKKVSLAMVRKHWLLFGLVGLGSTIWNFFLFYAINIAPNPGYVNATNTASIAVVTLFAAWLFNDHLSVRKCIGVFGVVGGLCLLFLA